MKKKFKRKYILINCFIIMFSFLFMASGYSILKTKLSIDGIATITQDTIEEWEPKLTFVNTGNLSNMFFYNIMITNNTKQTYRQWQLEIKNAEYISNLYLTEGEAKDDGWVLSNDSWDNRLDPGATIVISIIFDVDENLQSSMTLAEYAKYYVEHYITFNATIQIDDSREGNIVTNKNASLTLNESEIEVTDYIFEENLDYTPSTDGEKQYILTIYNNTSDKVYLKIRANIYLGNNKLILISPSEILCRHKTNTNFELPTWIQIESGQSASLYITFVSKDEGFKPDIVIAATVQ